MAPNYLKFGKLDKLNRYAPKIMTLHTATTLKYTRTTKSKSEPKRKVNENGANQEMFGKTKNSPSKSPLINIFKGRRNIL